MGIERTTDFYEGFKTNVELLYQDLLDKEQLSEEQKKVLKNRCGNIDFLTVQQLAEIQRDLASWTPCWNLLLNNNQDFGDIGVQKLWREGKFYEVLKSLTGQKNPKFNAFIDEATQYIDLKRIKSGEEVVGVTIAQTLDNVNNILTGS